MDRLAHVLAAFARQAVGIVLEPLQSLGAGEILALNLAVELGHDPVELFERAAQALAVLLREFGACEPINPASTAIAKASLRANID